MTDTKQFDFSQEHISSNTIAEAIKEITTKINEIETTNKSIVSGMVNLTNYIKKSKDDVEKTDTIVKYISDVSMQTKLLGFNASIEASRAKEHGSGFNVIAQEIRRLAETSNSQFSEIDSIIQSVKSSINSIDTYMNSTNEVIQNNIDTLSAVSELVGRISEQLNEM